jgi:hypothetical protein
MSSAVMGGMPYPPDSLFDLVGLKKILSLPSPSNQSIRPDMYIRILLFVVVVVTTIVIVTASQTHPAHLAQQHRAFVVRPEVFLD